MRRIILTSLVVLFFIQANAQSLYMPRDISRAYKKGTRSPDGKPGKNYWQNFGRYDITITAAPPDANIKGTETITYINNSPDTLRSINMKLILNIHREGAPRNAPASADYITPGLQIDTFLIADKEIKWNNTRASNTNQLVRVPQPLLPHDSVKLKISWHYQISKESNREGMIDPSTYYFAYFYPRVAVYDDHAGWDMITFTDVQEFYNDFNDYKLSVRVPKNFVVWGTGVLQNADKVLQPEFAKRLKSSMTSNEPIHVATAADMTAKKVTAQNDWNTWVFKSSKICDVAFGISDHYVWDAASVVVDKTKNRRASMQAAYDEKSADFQQSVKFGTEALGWFSDPKNWPGVPYPFPTMTAFQGFADMEYPMMVNDSHVEDLGFAQFVQNHEIAHTYFPFYMGINESRYAFMDEGWATTLELLIGREQAGKEAAEKLYKQFRVNGWINNAATAQDLPVITPADELKGGYGNNAYVKPSLGYLAMKDMLGDAVFKKALHFYMDNWNGKHPIPWDFFNSFNTATGKNLNWFFNNWFFSNGYIDLKVDKAAKATGGYAITVKNIGGYVAPFDVMLTYQDGATETLHQTSAIWEANQKQASVAVKTTKQLASVKLDGGIFMDATPVDNLLEVK